MQKIKTSYYKLSVPERIQQGYSILGAMQGNPHFPDAAANLAEFEAAVKKLEDTHLAAMNGDRVKRALAVLADENMKVELGSLGGYVQSVSKGDPEMVLSSGFELNRSGFRNTTQAVEIPAFLVVKPGRLEGEIIFSWDRVPGARIYTPQISEDNGETWEDCPMSTRSKILVSGLVSRSKPWFRVSAFGSLGHSGWSDAVQGKVA